MNDFTVYCRKGVVNFFDDRKRKQNKFTLNSFIRQENMNLSFIANQGVSFDT